MSVLVKGMSIPMKCIDCKLYQDSYPTHCKAVVFGVVDVPYRPPRPDWCPLVEVEEDVNECAD